MEKLLELDDITLLPAPGNSGWLGNRINYLVHDPKVVSGVTHTLPIFTSPMDSVVGPESWKFYQDLGIRAVLPRTTDLQERLEACHYIFCAFSVQEVKTYFLDQDMRSTGTQLYVCIDSGNGHDRGVIEMGAALKRLYSEQLLLMGGNIANPDTYISYCAAKFDYVRVGISSGSTVDKGKYGYHYPSASLLLGIYPIYAKSGLPKIRHTKVILDGGIRCHSDILKALAIGADYVMIGREFAKCLEAEGGLWTRGTDGKTVTEIRDPSKLYGQPLSKLQDLKLIRQYSGNTSLKNRATLGGYTGTSDYLKSSPKIKLTDSGWSWVNVDNTLLGWVQELKECIDYGFMMSNVSDWSSFKANSKFGRL